MAQVASKAENRVVAIKQDFHTYSRLGVTGLLQNAVDNRSPTLHFSEGGKFQPPPLSSMIPANSKDIKAHYSFDYAQMVSQ